ncbi:hypothetical protein GCM10023328_17220 [Modestobacter marinus]|uniref:Uncharacterized protein n=1 Tax=Modestobacter marinus TaxID=477641 RepID=A0ABQ2G840_9ACTN|nr:hypothetical protein GCM10011589_39480 [Modestobacter marinus]
MKMIAPTPSEPVRLRVVTALGLLPVDDVGAPVAGGSEMAKAGLPGPAAPRWRRVARRPWPRPVAVAFLVADVLRRRE